MTTEVTIYHNPRCSKSRQTLAMLNEYNSNPTVIEYLKEPLSFEQIQTLIELLGIAPHELLRTKEQAYRERNLCENSAPETIIQAVVEHPILLERPIVVAGKKAVFGRPPENINSIL